MPVPGAIVLKTPTHVLTHGERGATLAELAADGGQVNQKAYGTVAYALQAMAAANPHETFAALAGMLNRQAAAPPATTTTTTTAPATVDTDIAARIEAKAKARAARAARAAAAK